MVAQDQQHTAAWLDAANLPPRHAQEDRDQREKQKETDREFVWENTVSAEKGEGEKCMWERRGSRAAERKASKPEGHSDKMIQSGNVVCVREKEILQIYANPWV